MIDEITNFRYEFKLPSNQRKIGLPTFKASCRISLFHGKSNGGGFDEFLQRYGPSVTGTREI